MWRFNRIFFSNCAKFTHEASFNSYQNQIIEPHFKQFLFSCSNNKYLKSFFLHISCRLYLTCCLMFNNKRIFNNLNLKIKDTYIYIYIEYIYIYFFNSSTWSKLDKLTPVPVAGQGNHFTMRCFRLTFRS